MKFNAVVGNPPYQEETVVNSNSNGQNPRRNIFHYFQKNGVIIKSHQLTV